MIPRERPADMLAQLMRFWGRSGTDMARISAQMGPRFALSPNLISNLRRSAGIPNLFHIYSLSESLHLRLGSVFEIFGIDLDRFLRLQNELHQHRTRLIETCPFGSNRMVYVPSLLGPKVASKTTAPLWELVLGWRLVHSLTLRDATWRDRRYRYGKLGTLDTNAAPGIPPGASVQMRILEPEEIHHLDENAFYFVQYPSGYTVSHCAYQDGWLYLQSRNPSFNGRNRLQYGKEVLILGRITAFAASLPTVGYRRCPVLPEPKQVPPAIAPWDHHSLQSLFATERQRLGIKSKETESVNRRLEEALGIRVSPQYSRKFERSEHVAQTSKALTQTAAYAIRLCDMFHSCGISLTNPNKYDLEHLLSVNSPADLPEWPVSAPAPQPPELWQDLKKRWHEWPPLLSRLRANPGSTPYEIVRLYQGDDFSGLDPLIRPGSVIAIDAADTHIPSLFHDPHAHERDWARHLYVLRLHGHHKSPLICGYVHATSKEFHLTSHPDAHTTPIQPFPRSAVTVMGRVAGIASWF